MFSSPEIKKQILRGIKQIFVSFKITEARYCVSYLGFMLLYSSSTFYQFLIALARKTEFQCVVRISLKFKAFQIYLQSLILAPICIRKMDYIKVLKKQTVLRLLIKDLFQKSIKVK